MATMEDTSSKDRASSSKQLLDELLAEPAERFERRIQRAKKKEYSNRCTPTAPLASMKSGQRGARR